MNGSTKRIFVLGLFILSVLLFTVFSGRGNMRSEETVTVQAPENLPASESGPSPTTAQAIPPQTDIERTTEIMQSPVTFTVSGNTLSVVDGGVVIQTLTLDEMGEFAVGLSPLITTFITDQDVNYDGYADVAMLVSTGYAGVNNFYNYYLYNTQTKRLELSPSLQEISNPEFDPVQKTMVSSYRSGPHWYSETFEWNGTRYIQSGD